MHHVDTAVKRQGEASMAMSLGYAALFTAQVQPSVLFDTTGRLASCVCAMTDAAESPFLTAEDSPTEQSGAASAAPASPMPPPSELSSAGGSSSSVLDEQSGLLQKIKDLVDTQKALKEQKKKCATDMKNAMKRKKRLQGKASQLSDTDLVEVLRMRKAKKDSVHTLAST